MARAAVLALLAAAAVASGASASSSPALGASTATATTTAATTVTIDPADAYGAWEGWGVSLAWFANVFGSGASGQLLADVAFTLNASVPWPTGGSGPGAFSSLPGLGLTTGRYNVGGSANDTCCGGQRIVYSPSIPWWKQIQGYWIDWDSDDPTSASWDWSRDAAQRALAHAAAARGMTRLEVFSNSPMWWQLANHNPSGAADGGNNLLPAAAANHSHYMATVAAHLLHVEGLPVTSLELFNEPAAYWWKAGGTQEGCGFDASFQAAVLATLPAAMAAAGLNRSTVRVAASDESRLDMAVATWAAWGPSTKALVDQVNAHGYMYGGPRAAYYEAVVVQGGKVLHGSEFGDGDGSGAGLVSNLLADWAALHPRAWAYWQLLDVAGGWALIGMDIPAAGSPSLGAPTAKYFAWAQFTRHIRPGMTILGGGGDPRAATAAAYDAAARKLVVVSSNPSPAGSGNATLTFDLSRFAAVPPGPVALQRSTSFASATPSPATAYVAVTGAAVSGSKTLTISLPPLTVTTLELDGVVA